MRFIINLYEVCVFVVFGMGFNKEECVLVEVGGFVFFCKMKFNVSVYVKVY